MNCREQLYTLICILAFSFSCQSQTTLANENPDPVDSADCNLRDEQGRKYGLWVERNGYLEVYYKCDQRDGICKSYSRKTGKLLGFGEYKEGNKSGKWYFFDESSHLVFTEENIKENKVCARMRDDGVQVIPSFTSYLRNYYPNGVTKEEGQILYDEDVEIDYYKIGPWKYYDNEGTLKETKEEK